MPPKNLIVFDLDDTLLPSEKAYAWALRETLGIENLELYQEARKNVKMSLPAGSVNARNRVLYFKEYLTLKSEFSATKILKLNTEYEDNLKTYYCQKFEVDKTVAILQKLSENFDLAILTNENTRAQLLKISLLEKSGSVFKKILTSEELGSEKPDLRGFQLLQSQFKLKSEEITMVGDDFDKDIVPASSLGWKTILTEEHIQNESNLNNRKISKRISKISELLVAGVL